MKFSVQFRAHSGTMSHKLAFDSLEVSELAAHKPTRKRAAMNILKTGEGSMLWRLYGSNGLAMGFPGSLLVLSDSANLFR